MTKRIIIEKRQFEIFKHIAKKACISYDMQEYENCYRGKITAKEENEMLYFFYRCGFRAINILIDV